MTFSQRCPGRGPPARAGSAEGRTGARRPDRHRPRDDRAAQRDGSAAHGRFGRDAEGAPPPSSSRSPIGAGGRTSSGASRRGVPTLPPHITGSEARNCAEALARDDPEAGAILRHTLRSVVT